MRRPGIRKLLRLLAPSAAVSYYDRARLLLNLGSPARTALRAAASGDFLETSVHLFPRGFLKDIECIIDVGANVGRWSELILKLCAPTRLIAVEPAPAVRSQLEQALARWSSAEVVPVAAGPENGEVIFHVTRHSHNSSVMVPRSDRMDEIYRGGWAVDREVRVPQRTLDDIAADVDRISILKIDVQGYEAAVLAGAKETLRRCDLVVLEVTFQSHYENDELFPELHRIMSRHGFRLRAVATPSERGNELMWADAVYVRI